MQSRVAIVRGDRSIETVQRALDLIGGVRYLSDRPVLIKVNFISTKKWDTGATTDPIVTEALIKAIRPVNQDVYVVESNATFTDATKAARATGTLQLCGEYEAPFLNLSDLNETVKVPLNDPETLKEVTLPELVLRSHVVSAAKMKTHSGTTVTLGLKNMFGLLPDKFKMKYHSKGIGKVIVDINRVVSPALTVIDGFVAMEGSGPVNGTPVELGLIIAGRDVVATDAVAAKVMGFDPTAIYHIRRCAELGLGALDDVEIVGERLKDVSREFRRP